MKAWGEAGVGRKGAKVGKIGDICNTVNNKQKKNFFLRTERDKQNAMKSDWLQIQK